MVAGLTSALHLLLVVLRGNSELSQPNRICSILYGVLAYYTALGRGSNS